MEKEIKFDDGDDIRGIVIEYEINAGEYHGSMALVLDERIVKITFIRGDTATRIVYQ